MSLPIDASQVDRLRHEEESLKIDLASTSDYELKAAIERRLVKIKEEIKWISQ